MQSENNTKKCKICGEVKDVSLFLKKVNVCKKCSNLRQKINRNLNNYKDTKKYEKSKKGFLIRLYRNMKSRIVGIQHKKHHLYKNKELLDKLEFYNWALNNNDFHILFNNWEISGYTRKLTPSVDRIDSKIGYIITNMEWVTHSENSRRGAIAKKQIKEILK
jgi:hypothetical protein